MSLTILRHKALMARRLKLCNTSEMTLGRVLWIALGFLLTSWNIAKGSMKLRKCQLSVGSVCPSVTQKHIHKSRCTTRRRSYAFQLMLES